jgi:methyl-accepting chemotaxis protein
VFTCLVTIGIPLLVLNGLIYYLNNQLVKQEIDNVRQASRQEIFNSVNNFLLLRKREIELLAKLEFLINPKFREFTHLQNKQAQLNNWQLIYKSYDSIAVSDLNGDVILQTKGQSLSNQKKQEYFQAVLNTNKPYISQSISTSYIYIAAPIKDKFTRGTIYVIRATIPIKSLEQVINHHQITQNRYYLIDASGKTFLSRSGNLNVHMQRLFTELELQAQKTLNTTASINKLYQDKLVSYINWEKIEELPELNWKLITTKEKLVLIRSLEKILLNIAILTLIIVVVLSGAIAYVLNRVLSSDSTSPNQEILKLIRNMELVSKGDLTQRVEVTSGEIGSIAYFFNSIVENFREVVTQVQLTAYEVKQELALSSEAINKFAFEVTKQAKEINNTRSAVDSMRLSIKSITKNASKAVLIARNSCTVEAASVAVALTVENILNLQEIMTEASKNVNSLRESSQQISRISLLSNEITLKSNILAINADIEAVRFSEDYNSNIAEEIAILTARSVAVVEEVELMINNIYLEINEVVKALELGNRQIVEGTHLGEDTKELLSNVLESSHYLDDLLHSIYTTNIAQVRTSKDVSNFMKKATSLSEYAYDLCQEMSTCVEKIVNNYHKLEVSTRKFKIK